MQHINKDDKNRPKCILNNRRLFDEWFDDKGTYSGLSYDKQLADTYITQDILDGQSYYCCYCMRKLYPFDEGEHKANVTLEHIIPNNVTQTHWDRYRGKYEAYRSLRPDRIEVCIGGSIQNRNEKLSHNDPIPHFLAYDNIVGSCDGRGLSQEAALLPCHCCNLKRKSSFVEPYYLDSKMAISISYDKNGNVICDESMVSSLSYDKNTETGVNIMGASLNRIRRFWYLIAFHHISKQDVEDAINDIDKRDDIITQLSATRSTVNSWLFLGENKAAWLLVSEYHWFFDYYTKEYNIL